MIAYVQLSWSLLCAGTGPLEWRLRWNWDWPLWLSTLAVFAAAIWVLTVYLCERSPIGRGMRILLSTLRLTALGFVLFLFAQPAVEGFRLGRPRLVVLVDRSNSMGTLDRYSDSLSEIARFAAMKQWLVGGEKPRLERWQTDYQLDVVTFGAEVQHLTAGKTSLTKKLKSLELDETIAGGTCLGDAIDFSLRELPGPVPLGLVVLSDGIVTQGQTLEHASERARWLRVPIYSVAVGSERRRPDIALENLLVEEIVFPGDRLQVEATVRATGYEGQTAEVVLQDTTTSVLARTNVTLPADGETQTVRLAIRPNQPGLLSLELAIESRDDEQDFENNTLRQVVDVRDEKIRVLFVQSQPSYEYRALKSLLERDPAVELQVLLQEADADYPSVDETAIAAFPINEKNLFLYDVLILGDVDLSLLPRSVWPLVERFVTEHGGGLIGIAGPRFMPMAYRGLRALEVLLPMELESLNPLRSQINGANLYTIAPTSLGWRTPSLQLGETPEESQHIWEKLPPVSWMLRIENIKPGAQVLAECPGEITRQTKPLPVILRHYVGAGEVLFHATDETWRWRWRTDDRYFARYWGQVTRRLGRRRLAAGLHGVRFTSNRSVYEPGEPVQLQVRFRNPLQAPAEEKSVVVQLQSAIGPPRSLVLQRRTERRGLFTATIEDLSTGEYEAVLVQPDLQGGAEVVRFELRHPCRELAELVVNRSGLRQTAERTGGKAFSIFNATDFTDALPPPRQQALEGLPLRPLWNRPWGIGLFVLVLSLEWLLRRRCGML